MSRFYFKKLLLFFEGKCSTIKIQNLNKLICYFSFVWDLFCHPSIKLLKGAWNFNHQLIYITASFEAKSSKSWSKHCTSLKNWLIKCISQGIMLEEKFFKNFIRVPSKSVPSLQLSLCKMTLFQLLPTILIVECPFYRITENFISLGDFWKMMIWCSVFLFCKFRVPS